MLHKGTGRSFPRMTLMSVVAIQILMLAVLALASSAFASGPAEHIIYNFSSLDTTVGLGSLVADKAGNLYGTTAFYGPPPNHCGAVFELSPPSTASGKWTETTLYAFQGGANDGCDPFGTLIFDSEGNLYGTTQAGGSNNTGTVFELSPPSSQGEAWTETVLYLFPADESQGYWPEGNLVFDSAGNLYGTATRGGAGTNPSCDIGCGTLFEISPPATKGGAWTGSAIHSFGVTSGDGMQPANNLVMRGGAIYGTTIGGGTGNCTGGCGTFFEFVPTNGSWSENILFSFDSEGGPVFAFGGVIFDPQGNAYGTARQGGFECGVSIYGSCGGVFELSPPAVSGNPWTMTTLYEFTGGQDGGSPYCTLVRDSAGNLYGTNPVGGLPSKTTTTYGTVFKLSPPAVSGGTWTETTLHKFFGGTTDASGPTAGLVQVHGPLYGTAGGGNDVFVVAP